MRRSVSYHIVKDTPRDPEFWDGPYTLAKATKLWKLCYMNKQDPQDFVVVKVTNEQVIPVKRPRKRG